MPISIPSSAALHSTFCSSNPVTIIQQKVQQPPRTKYQARPELYGAWSAVDDAKAKASQLSDKAVKEFDKASATAQAKTGHIEMYSAKFYAACTFGGLLACVSAASPQICHGIATKSSLGSHPHSRDSSRSCQMPPSSRFQNVHRQFPSLGKDRPC